MRRLAKDVDTSARAYRYFRIKLAGIKTDKQVAQEHFNVLILMMGVNKLKWTSNPETIVQCFYEWKQSIVKNSHVIKLVENQLHDIKKNIMAYCYDPKFYRPYGESTEIHRRKRFCRLRIHRKGNDMSDEDETYEWYPIESLMQMLYENYQAGNFNLTGRVPVSQCK